MVHYCPISGLVIVMRLPIMCSCSQINICYCNDDVYAFLLEFALMFSIIAF